MKKKQNNSKSRSKKRLLTPKQCYFCTENKKVSYMDVEILRRFITERGKIIGRIRSGLCAKHQKGLTIAIKHARHLALIPFTGKQ